MKNKKKIISIASCLLAAVLSFGVAGCRKSDGSDFPTGSSEPVKVEGAVASEITGGYEKGTARATQTSEYLGTVDKIVKPVKDVVDEHETYGVKEYPTYGKVLKGYTAAERDGLIQESHALAPSPSWKSLNIYNAIDSEGYLLKNGQRITYSANAGSNADNEDEQGESISGEEDLGENKEEVVEGSTSVNKQYNEQYRKLYKHTAALTHFGGGLTDDEPRIVKKVTALTHAKLESTTITGLYAPAGEVVKFEMSLSDYLAAGGIRVLIGQNYNLYQHVSMETSGNGVKGNTGLNRMPDILSIFQYNDANGGVVKDGNTVTFYVGSFFGGPIYFRPIKNEVERKVTVTISGAVKYQHFILGVTTPEEYEFNKASTAPYFDLEVFDSVRFTTTKHTSSGGLSLKDYTYENCTDAAILWDKIAEVSTRVQANGLSGASAPVYIIGDCYIAAGAAFANPGRNGVVCPPSWLAEALNYNNFVNSGCWGTMHEYNHCWQGFGLKNGGEVTNNATTLIAYSLYTRISQGRTTATGWGNGSWNRFTDPSKALGELLSLGANGSIREDLSVYATLIHNIGQEQFIKAAKGGKESGSTVYFNNLVNATHLDMTYYFNDVLHLGVDSARGISQAAADAAKDKNYPMFVPVSSVYQVGRSIIYDGKKEYITTAQPFSYGTGEFTMDFSNKNNFKGNNWASKALVIPDGFTVTVKSVSQPANGTVTLDGNQVKYTPKSGGDALYSGEFKVTLGITKNDNAFKVDDVDLVINLKQSSSTALNRTTYVYGDSSKVPSTDSVYNAATKSFNFGDYTETKTRKNVCTQETNTQIWAADRNYNDDVYNANSTNYETLEVGKAIQTLDGVMYFSKAGTYRFTLKGRGNSTLYLSYDNGTTWTPALTISRTSGNSYIDSEYAEHEFTTTGNYVYFKVVHSITQANTFFGIGVASKQSDGSFTAFANAIDAVTPATVDIDKKIKEESAKKFETDYYFESNYSYSYSGTKISASSTKLVSVSHESWDDTVLIDNMFDGKSNTYYHSKAGEENYITEEKPFELVVDLGSLNKVNSVTFNGYKGDYGKNNNGMVKNFKLYGSKDGTKYTLLTEQVDAVTNKSRNITYSFDATEIRYYKLVVTKTDNGRYFAMNSIDLSYSVPFGNDKGTMVSPHDAAVKYTGTWGTQNVLCDYGIIYTANAGAYVEYTFTGTRVAYFAYMSEDYGTVDIYLDGKLVASDVSLAGSNVQVSQTLYNSFGETNATKAGALAYIYSDDALTNSEHVLKIVGKSGTFNVESFACWH